MGEPTIYKPSIYNGAGIYNNGSGGGGGGGGDLPEGYYDGYINLAGKNYPYVRITNGVRTYDIMANNLDYIDENISQDLVVANWDDRTPRSCYYNNNPSLFGPEGYNFGRLYTSRALDYMWQNRASILGSLLSEGWTFIPEITNILGSLFTSKAYEIKDLLTWKYSEDATTPTNLSKLNFQAAGTAQWVYPNKIAPVFSGLGETVIVDFKHTHPGGEDGYWITLNYNSDVVTQSSGQSGNFKMQYTRLARLVS